MIRKIIAGAILIWALAPQGRQVAQQGPLSMFLLSRPCANTGVGNWARRTEDVGVGRAYHESRLFMGPGERFASFTCRLQPNRANVTFQRLRLAFGMRDNDQGSPPVTVHVYLDGARASSRTVSPGQPALVSLNVTGTSNIALEAVCSTQLRVCERVYFWEAELEYPPLPPGRF